MTSRTAYPSVAHPHLWRAPALSAILALLLCLVQPQIARATAADDSLKADRLVNFLKFIDWPPEQDTMLEICFLGADAIRETLIATLADRRVGVRHLTVQSVNDSEATTGCSVLYIDAAWRANNPALREPERKHMLTISDSTDFAARGGMIELVMVRDHLRFTVDLSNIRRVGLHVSSSLLEIATVRR